MSKKNYKLQYQHPNWQKKRLEILERDYFRCKFCNNDQENLNIHHKFYIKNRDIWDYPDYYFITLCNSCHLKMHDKIELFNDLIARMDDDYYLWLYFCLKKPINEVLVKAVNDDYVPKDKNKGGKNG